MLAAPCVEDAELPPMTAQPLDLHMQPPVAVMVAGQHDTDELGGGTSGRKKQPVRRKGSGKAKQAKPRCAPAAVGKGERKRPAAAIQVSDSEADDEAEPSPAAVAQCQTAPRRTSRRTVKMSAATVMAVAANHDEGMDSDMDSAAEQLEAALE